MMLPRVLPTVVGVILATSGHISGDAALAKKIGKWLLRCRYSPRKTPHKERMKLLMAETTRRLRNLTKSEMKQVEKILTTFGSSVGTLVDTISELRNPLQKLQLSSRSAEGLNTILEYSHLERPVAFWWAFPFWKQAFAKKIAEGAYGEIYSTEQISGVQSIVKIVAVHGYHPTTRICNTTFDQEVPDVVCSVHLSELSEGTHFRAPNFPKLYRLCLVKAPFPKPVMKAWLEFAASTERRDDPQECPRPDSYERDQLFVTFEMASCGTDLTKLRINDPITCAAWICQIISALAVAESAYQFEHRDLHMGNVLVKTTPEKTLEYVVDDFPFQVLTLGHHVFIIDFSMSRITARGKTHFFNIDPDTYNQHGNLSDNQDVDWCDHMQIYKMEAQACDEDWTQYRPVTNLLWVRHLIENFLSCLIEELSLEYLTSDTYSREAFLLLERWRYLLMHCDSAMGFVRNVLFNDCPFIIVQ